MRTTFLLLCFAFVAGETTAQPTNFGKEFYAVFAKHEGENGVGKTFKLYLHGPRSTTAHVEVPALSFSLDVPVVPGVISTVDLPHGDDSTVELRLFGFVLSGLAVHITSEDEISVVALSAKEFSSDAFLVYPLQTLGKQYVVLSSENSLIPGAEASSLFTIAATEASTNVTIIPKADMVDGRVRNVPFTVKMNKGEAIMIASDPLKGKGDLTGSVVTADRPIAVFSGHQRTEIPAGYKQPGTDLISRDHLYEQLLPNEVLGDILVIVPYNGQIITTQQYVRVVTTQPATNIMVDGVPLTFDSTGDYFGIDSLSAPVVVTSNHPIIGSQYMHSATGGAANEDPSLALILSTNLYRQNHSFVLINAPVYTSHGISIIASSQAPLVKLDGFVLPTSMYSTIPNSDFSYASLTLDAGLHHVSSNVPVNITAYGTGTVISYAYNTGLGSDIPASVTTHRSATTPLKVSAAFDDNNSLIIRSHVEHSLRIRVTLYDIGGRKLFSSNETISLSSKELHVTDYKLETRPTYLLIQEYDAFDQVLGRPLFLPVP